MKKSAILSFVTIVGLMVMCVMTLLAVYATGPESSILLLEESFAKVDENRWTHQVSECTEAGEEFQYIATDGGSGFIADGILHLHPNLSTTAYKIKRETPTQCRSCSNCSSSSLFSVSISTKNTFNATSGKIEIGANFGNGKGTTFRVGVISNDSQPEDDSESIARPDDFDQVVVVLKSGFNKTVLKSPVTQRQFHVYVIEWNPEGITLRVDDKKVDERRFEPAGERYSFSNETEEVTETRGTQSFYISLGMDKLLRNGRIRPGDASTEETGSEEDGTVLEIDYIKLFRLEE